MNKVIHSAELIQNLKTSDFFLNCKLPIEYTDDFPIVTIRNETLCLMIPYLKYKLTGEVDKTLVYPVRYVLTVSLPDEKIVKFEDLKFNPLFADLDFSQPIGLFRHESVRKLDRAAYKQKRAELYEMYDKVIAAILYGDDYTSEDEQAFAKLLQMMLEPSQHPIYKALDKDFYEKYLG